MPRGNNPPSPQLATALAWQSLAWVAAGGFVGSLLRAGADALFARIPNPDSVTVDAAIAPSTWVVNLGGALLLGWVSAWAFHRRSQRESARPDRVLLLIGTGFCGSLTTYGTLAVDIGQPGASWTLWAQAALMVAVGIALAFGGWNGSKYWSTRRLARRDR